MTASRAERRRDADAGGGGDAGLGAQRRKELRQQRRQERWRNLWRILVLAGSATGLGWVLLREGWVLRSPSQIEVLGSRQVNREQVIREGQLQLPLQLLNLRPQQLTALLSAGLPVEQVQVTRLMLPPRLRIELVDRQAVARAERHTPAGLETGYIDRLGNWINQRQSSGVHIQPVGDLVVSGWNERHSAVLATVLAQRQAFGGTLWDQQTIRQRLSMLDAKTRAARQFMYHCAWSVTQEKDIVQEVSMLKALTGDLVNEVVGGCLQFWGGMGYMREAPIERLWRDARVLAIGGGATEVMLEEVAKRY